MSFSGRNLTLIMDNFCDITDFRQRKSKRSIKLRISRKLRRSRQSEKSRKNEHSNKVREIKCTKNRVKANREKNAFLFISTKENASETVIFSMQKQQHEQHKHHEQHQSTEISADETAMSIIRKINYVNNHSSYRLDLITWIDKFVDIYGREANRLLQRVAGFYIIDSLLYQCNKPIQTFALACSRYTIELPNDIIREVMSYLQPRCIASMGRGYISDRTALMNTNCIPKIIDTFMSDKYFIDLISKKEARIIDEEYSRALIIGCEDCMECPPKHLKYVHLICETLGKPTIMGRL